MALFSLHTPPVMEDPVMIMGLAGWGDAASAASDAADWLAEDAPTVVSFDPDAIFDYRSNRPVLRISGGELISVTWPKLEIVHIAPGGRDVLVMVGNEPIRGGQWISYTASLSWTLYAGQGLKTVYVRYRDDLGIQAVASDTIWLESLPIDTRLYLPLLAKE